jgi:decaprenyl-phosphate phosphoribosyltransferase
LYTTAVTVRDYIALSRPKDWIKNVFVFMPVPFGLASGAHFEPRSFALGLLGFCLANSAVYSFNDAQDSVRDRAHLTKKNRPVAAGRISVRAASVWALLLAVVSALVSWQAHRPGAVSVSLLYFAINLVYSLGAKHVALLDVFLLASGFVLRVLLGCYLLEIPPSNPLLLCSYALALFLALAKRRADLVNGLDSSHRPSLEGYNQAFLDQAITIAAAMTIVNYTFYSLESSVLLPNRKFASLPFVMFGVLDYLRRAHVQKAGGSPVDLLLTSPVLLATGVGWLLSVVWSVKFP